jgi:hypothetical protein
MAAGDGFPPQMRERKNDFEVVGDYNIPYMGRLEIIHAQTSTVGDAHGKYFGRINLLGIVARYSETEKEALAKASEEIALHMLRRRKELSDEVHQIDSLIPTTSFGIITSGDWLKQYETKRSVEGKTQ